MALILNIETATKICSVALAKDGELISFREQGGQYSHAELITTFIQEVIADAQIEIKDLDAVSISKGPGSYTGLRIGVSTAKGLCYSLDKPMISVSTLQAMALGAVKVVNDKNALFCPMIDAKRMEVYTALFDADDNEVREIKADIIDENSFSEYLAKNKIYFFGDGADKCRETITHPNAIFKSEGLPSAKNMICISEKKFQNKLFEDVAYFEPFYLKDFIAGVSRVKGLH
ncbi:MAG: tRNA (adenosine(37)-N6)-threonylcarbamoyltransferase complex dimerization subunit type 1 TsaB [Saprospiraceae bacterium]|nr:tRNA (adenosine(37)-N6)-threonylcarbamoyltransferase complex dimerization subunit type 1 TsaB [Saprospiraceae bacterium]